MCGALRLTSSESSPLLDCVDLEVVHLHDRAEILCCLPQSGALVPSPEAVVDYHVVAQFKGSQPDLDEPSFDHVLGRRRVLVAVESLHPFVLREAKCLLLALDASGGCGLAGTGKAHG